MLQVHDRGNTGNGVERRFRPHTGVLVILLKIKWGAYNLLPVGLAARRPSLQEAGQHHVSLSGFFKGIARKQCPNEGAEDGEKKGLSSALLRAKIPDNSAEAIALSARLPNEDSAYFAEQGRFRLRVLAKVPA